MDNMDNTTVLTPNDMPNPENQQPVYEQPVYEQPVYEQPVYEQPVYEQPVYEQPTYEQPVYEEPGTPAPKKTNVLAIISLVCGILSIILSCCCGWATFLFGPASVILGAVSPKNEKGKKSGMAIAGIILGIVSVVLFIGSLILSLIFPALGAMLSEISSPTTYY